MSVCNAVKREREAKERKRKRERENEKKSLIRKVSPPPFAAGSFVHILRLSLNSFPSLFLSTEKSRLRGKRERKINFHRERERRERVTEWDATDTNEEELIARRQNERQSTLKCLGWLVGEGERRKLVV